MEKRRKYLGLVLCLALALGAFTTLGGVVILVFGVVDVADSICRGGLGLGGGGAPTGRRKRLGRRRYELRRGQRASGMEMGERKEQQCKSDHAQVSKSSQYLFTLATEGYL